MIDWIKNHENQIHKNITEETSSVLGDRLNQNVSAVDAAAITNKLSPFVMVSVMMQNKQIQESHKVKPDA